MRAQAHTLEGVVAALLLLTSLVFALQLTAVTPLSASTSSQHIENQQRATGSGILASAAETGALEEAVLYWNESGERFHNATTGGEYTDDPPDNRFGQILQRSFDRKGIAYNVYFRFKNDSNYRRVRYIFNGIPSDNAVSASYTLTLTDDDRLYAADGTRTGVSLQDSSTYLMSDEGANVYNTVRVEVVAWRI